MQKSILILALGVFGIGLMAPRAGEAQGPSGEIRAEPNPCHIEPGKDECTTHLIWHTRGVEHAKVFVTAKGRKVLEEREFSDSRNCEGHNCRAPWIEHGSVYKFQLFDFTRGDRGRMLGEVEVRPDR